LLTGLSFLLRLSCGVTQARFRIFVIKVSVVCSWTGDMSPIPKRNPPILESLWAGAGPHGVGRIGG